MGSGASKKRKQAEPVTVEAPVSFAASNPDFAPPAFQTQYQPSAPPYQPSLPSYQPYPSLPTGPPAYPSIPAYPPAAFPTYQVSVPPQAASVPHDEDSPAILFDDGNAPVSMSAAASDAPTGLFTLDTVHLNGQWIYLPDESEIEMEPVMSHYVEKAFVRGLSSAQFKFQGSPCVVSFRDMALTVQTAEGQTVYPVARRTEGRERLVWMADDQTLRPFIPEAEELVLLHREEEAVFQMDNDLLNVSVAKGVIVDVTTGVEHFLQLID